MTDVDLSEIRDTELALQIGEMVGVLLATQWAPYIRVRSDSAFTHILFKRGRRAVSGAITHTLGGMWMTITVRDGTDSETVQTKQSTIREFQDQILSDLAEYIR